MKTIMKTEQELITPEMATKYLAEAAVWMGENNMRQRNITESHVIHLAQQMTAGQWLMTGQPIIFNEYGIMIDGQQRMSAVAKSGKTIEFTVTRGVPNSSFPGIDRNKPRSNGNLFAIMGVANYNTVAACVNGVMNYRRARATPIRRDGIVVGYGGSLNSYLRPSSSDLTEEYIKNPEKYNLAAGVAICCRSLAPQSIIATVAALALIESRHSYGDVSLFWDRFRDGVGLEEKDPILFLRNKMALNSGARSKMPACLITMMIIKAWNLYAQSKTCTMIRMIDGEPCPEIL